MQSKCESKCAHLCAHLSRPHKCGDNLQDGLDQCAHLPHLSSGTDINSEQTLTQHSHTANVHICHIYPVHLVDYLHTALKPSWNLAGVEPSSQEGPGC